MKISDLLEWTRDFELTEQDADAFESGYDARMANKKITANPNLNVSECWEAGWKKADKALAEYVANPDD